MQDECTPEPEPATMAVPPSIRVYVDPDARCVVVIPTGCPPIGLPPNVARDLARLIRRCAVDAERGPAVKAPLQLRRRPRGGDPVA